MTNWRATVRALELPMTKLEQRTRQFSSQFLIAFSVLLLIFLGVLVFDGYTFLNAWRYNDWSSYWSSIAPSFLAVFFVVLLTALWRSAQYSFASLLQVRQAANAGDDALAPLAAPGELASGNEPLYPGNQLRLRRPEGGRQTGRLALGITCLLMGVTLAPILEVPLIPSWQEPGGLLLIAIFAGVVLLFLGLGLILVVTARRRRFVRIQIESAGLSWRQGRRATYAAWQELQAFTTVQYQRSYYDPTHHEAYLLDASSAVLAWELTDTSPEAEDEAHQYLCDQIVAHTSLRLRDLTQSIEKLDREAQAARGAAGKIPARAQPTPSPAIPGLPSEATNPHLAPSRAPRKLPLGCLGPILLLLPAFLLYPLGWAGQAYEPHYYAALAARAQAELPLYQNTLAAADGDWCVQTPSAKDPEFYKYVNYSYRMGGGKSSQFMDCWITTAYTNYAVEVTSQQLGSDPQNDGIGLELRVSQDQSRMQVFDIDQEGDWNLWDYEYHDSAAANDWGTIDYGYSSAIHQGAGASNRLLAIAHGDQFFLYINGVYLTTDTDANAESSGYIGLFSNDAALTSVFTNFVVYPLPSLAPLLPWGS